MAQVRDHMIQRTAPDPHITVKKTTATWVLRSLSVRKTTQPQEQHKVVDLDAEETVAERVAKLFTLQAGARASSSPDHRKGIRQSPRLSAKSDKSARSDMKSGSQPPKPTGNRLTFADAVAVAPTPEEQKARERAEAQKRKNNQKGPEEGKAGKQD